MPIAELGEGLLVRLLTALQTRLGSAIGAGVLIAESPEKIRQVASVGVAQVWDEMQIEAGAGPLVQAVQAEKAVVTDPLDLGAYPDLAGIVDVIPRRTPAAMVVVPNSWTGGRQLVTVIYLAAPVADSDLEAIGHYEPLLAYALGLLEYCGEAETQTEQMVRMVQTRRWIEQAKGMIMTRRSIGPDDAFAVIVEHSQASNVKVRDLSTALVGLLAGPDGGPDVTQEAIAAAKKLWEDVSTRSRQ